MTEIRIDYAGAAEANHLLRNTLRELDVLEGELAALQGTVAPELQARYEIGARLRHCHALAESLQEQVRKLRKAAVSGSTRYQELDARLATLLPQPSAAPLEGRVYHEADGG